MSAFQAGCYYGHSANDNGRGVRELLRDHLARVADYAARFAAVFGAEEQARAAGLLHGLGKYADQGSWISNIVGARPRTPP